jgi:putative AlgH/UPF0301 family transcriptional regulator
MKDNLFHRRNGTAGTLAGNVLIAHPILEDDKLAKALIFVEEDTGKGVEGFILNRPMNIMLKALGEKFDNLPVSHTPVYYGGTEGETTVMLTAWVFDYDRRTFEIYYSLNAAEAAEMLESGKDVQLRAFLGFCKFDAKIYDDIETGLWIVGDAKNLFGSDEHEESLWQVMLLQENPHALVYR